MPTRAKFSGLAFYKRPRNAAVLALGRLRAGAMNRLEASYADYLEIQKIAGDILWYKFEGIKLRLADSTFYTCDFAVLKHDGALEMHEVKGHFIGDGRTKIKIAADLYPLKFLVIRAEAKSRGGGWVVEEI